MSAAANGFPPTNPHESTRMAGGSICALCDICGSGPIRIDPESARVRSRPRGGKAEGLKAENLKPEPDSRWASSPSVSSAASCRMIGGGAFPRPATLCPRVVQRSNLGGDAHETRQRPTTSYQAPCNIADCLQVHRHDPRCDLERLRHFFKRARAWAGDNAIDGSAATSAARFSSSRR